MGTPKVHVYQKDFAFSHGNGMAQVGGHRGFPFCFNRRGHHDGTQFFFHGRKKETGSQSSKSFGISGLGRIIAEKNFLIGFPGPGFSCGEH